MAEMQTEEDLIYQAWRDSESYQVPMTAEGERLAEIRLYAFTKGWKYAKFHTKTNDVYMKDYYDYGPRDLDNGDE
jgi:hypothetical protein